MGLREWKEKNSAGLIELYGNTEIIVDGCKSVLDYCDDSLKIDIGEKGLKITGRDLVIVSFIYEQIDICGEIASVEFLN